MIRFFHPLLAAVLALSGCALSPPALEAPRPLYVVSGKIVARPQNAPARAASFEWRRTQTADGRVADGAVFRRHGVLAARLTISPEKVTVETASGEVFEGETLPAARLGFPLPARALGYWLAGESDPSASTVEILAESGVVGRIVQHGWEIVYAARDAEGRPTRIEAAFPGGTAVVDMKRTESAE